MANLVTYVKQAWQDAKTAITAARLNHMEDGINDCATQINKLGDSVSRIVFRSGSISISATEDWAAIDFIFGQSSIGFASDGKTIQLYKDGVMVKKL